MNKLPLFLIILITVLFFTACQPDIEEAQVGFCQALDNYSESVGALREINAQTTVAELKEIREDIERSRDNLLESATTLREARLRYTEDAWDNLNVELDNIPGETTLGEAANLARIETAVLLTEIDRVYNVSCGRR